MSYRYIAETLKERGNWRQADIDLRIILKLKTSMLVCGLNTWQVTTAGSCEHENEPSGSIKAGAVF
jgi:hypothetical protein